MGVGFPPSGLERHAFEMNIRIFALAENLQKNGANDLAEQLRGASDSATDRLTIEWRGSPNPHVLREHYEAAQKSMHEVLSHLGTAGRLQKVNLTMLGEAEAFCSETSAMLDAYLESQKASS
jgi:four helix bundle protein